LEVNLHQKNKRIQNVKAFCNGLLFFMSFYNLSFSQQAGKDEIIKAIAIGNQGCNIGFSTLVQNSGQYNENKIIFPKGSNFIHFDCDNCLKDFSNPKYDIVIMKGKKLDYAQRFNCDNDTNSLSISNDSIYTLTNIHDKYSVFENVKNIKGTGGDHPFTSVIITAVLDPAFEFVSCKENCTASDFKFKNPQEIFLTTKNTSDITYELKYKRRSSAINITVKEHVITNDAIIKIYDNLKEDDDIINLYIDNGLVLQNYIATNDPREIPIVVLKESVIKIENVSEGQFPPNTIIVEVIDGENKIIIPVKTSKKEAFELKLIRN